MSQGADPWHPVCLSEELCPKQCCTSIPGKRSCPAGPDSGDMFWRLQRENLIKLLQVWAACVTGIERLALAAHVEQALAKITAQYSARS